MTKNSHIRTHKRTAKDAAWRAIQKNTIATSRFGRHDRRADAAHYNLIHANKELALAQREHILHLLRIAKGKRRERLVQALSDTNEIIANASHLLTK